MAVIIQPPQQPPQPSSALSRLLARYPPLVTVFCSLVGFTTYFAAYALRKPYRAALYADYPTWGQTGIQFKTALTLAQMLGYISASFVGLKLVSEMPRTGWRRIIVLFSLSVLANLGLVLFAVLPHTFKPFGIFLTGVPFGLIWGLLVTYFEGRRGSDIIMCVMSCSSIVSSGMTKDFGIHVLNHWNVSEYWMPAVCGAVFSPVFIICLLLLTQIPAPSDADKKDRVPRKPMYHTDRMAYLRAYWPGLICINFANFFLAAYRDFRDTYGAEIFLEMGSKLDNGIFTQSELIVGVGVVLVVGSLGWVKTNFHGLLFNFSVIFFGYLLLAVSVVSLDWLDLQALGFMIMTGLSSYFGYVPYGGGFYERKIAYLSIPNASASFPGQIGSIIASIGTITVFLLHSLGSGLKMDSYLGFFRAYSIFLSCLGTVTTVGGGVYFLWWKKRQLDLVRKSSVMEEDGEGIRGEIVVNLGGGGVGDEKKK